MFFMVSEETLVQGLTFLFQYANRHLNTSFANLLYATSLHFGKWVYAANHTPLYTFLYNKVTARRRLAIVGTGFQ